MGPLADEQGAVTDRYKVIQNREAFAFTDALLGEGVRYETVGSLQGGRKVWLLAHMPHEYIITGERISPYLLFSNTHDVSGAIKVALKLQAFCMIEKWQIKTAEILANTGITAVLCCYFYSLHNVIKRFG